MLEKRIIPCLDAKDERMVKGVNFVNLTDVGDSVDAAHAYYEARYDELVFLDIIATHEKRDTTVEMVERAVDQVFIPFTVGGGICLVEDMNKTLKVGADKVAVSSSAVANPQLIKDCAEKSGNQCVVSAIGACEKADNTRRAYVVGGRRDTDIDLIEWTKTVVSLGVGETSLASVDKDGTKPGFDLDMLNAIVDVVSVPVIASGGVGNTDYMIDVSRKTVVTGAPTVSIFYFGETSITGTKAVTAAAGIEVR